jgi:hypothetical protein
MILDNPEESSNSKSLLAIDFTEIMTRGLFFDILLNINYSAFSISGLYT